MGRPAVELCLSDAERKELQRRVRARSSAQVDVQRARIVLACEGGHSAQHVATQLQISRSQVEKWRKRFCQCGLEGLRDAPRSGRPRVFKTEQRLEIVALACEPLPGEDGKVPETGRTTRSIDELVEAAKQRKIVDSIGWGTVQRILSQVEVKPHRDQQWLHSPDPEFREKVTSICQVYLSPPAPDEVVLCIDEKPGMQALERKYPARPPGRGRLRRREFEYKRHGTQTLIAALNVHTGEVLAHCGETRKAKDLESFMESVAEAYPNKKVRVIWDCLNIHFDGPSQRWTRFNEKHGGRFEFIHTPIHASWVNQIECFFSILQRSSLNRSSFCSQAALRETVMNFIAHWNTQCARPFKWKFKGYPLQTGMDVRELAA